MNIDLAGGIPSGNHSKAVSTKKKLNIGAIFIITIVMVTVGAFGFFMWQKWSLTKNIKKLDTSIENTEKEIKELQGLNDTQGKQTRATILKKALLFRTNWSRVMSSILKYESPQVQFLSFSSNEKQEISIDGEARSIEEVAKLVEKLETNEEIKNPFVSTIVGQTKGAQKVKFRLVFELLLPTSNEK